MLRHPNVDLNAIKTKEQRLALIGASTVLEAVALLKERIEKLPSNILSLFADKERLIEQGDLCDVDCATNSASKFNSNKDAWEHNSPLIDSLEAEICGDYSPEDLASLYAVWEHFKSELNIDGVLDNIDIFSDEVTFSCDLRFVSSLPYECEFHFDLQYNHNDEFSLTVNTISYDVGGDLLFRVLPGFRDELKSALGTGSFNCLAFNKLDPAFCVTPAFTSNFEFFRTIQDADIYSNSFHLLIGDQLSNLCGSFTAKKIAFEKTVTKFNDYQLNKPQYGNQLEDSDKIYLANKLFCQCDDNKAFFTNFCLPEPHRASAILDIAQEIAETLELALPVNRLIETYRNISPYCVGFVKNHFRNKNVIDHLDDYEGLFSHKAFSSIPNLSEAFEIQLDEFNSIKLSADIDSVLSYRLPPIPDIDTETADSSLSVSNSL